MNKDVLLQSLRMACDWLTDISQVQHDDDVTAADRERHPQVSWRGAMRGEYRAAERQWSFFCPVWHTGQAVKALVMGSAILKEESEKYLRAATMGADFILANQVRDNDDTGLILAYEDRPEWVNTSAILECLDGLFLLAKATGGRQYRDAAIAALDWIARKAYLDNEGLFLDAYVPQKARFQENAFGVRARPLLDDAVFLTGFELTNNKRFRKIAIETAEQLLNSEEPRGNWINYPPANRERGSIHPRHAYWWGLPMLEMHQHCNEDKYLHAFLRSADWYTGALRKDGGLLRNTYVDFNTDSFGHATSGAACAAICFTRAAKFLEQHPEANLPETIVRDRYLERMRELADLGVDFCAQMQFTSPADPNLRGAILEKVLPPDGSDRSPYHVRDLGTIFFIQAAVQFLA